MCERLEKARAFKRQYALLMLEVECPAFHVYKKEKK